MYVLDTFTSISTSQRKEDLLSGGLSLSLSLSRCLSRAAVSLTTPIPIHPLLRLHERELSLPLILSCTKLIQISLRDP